MTALEIVFIGDDALAVKTSDPAQRNALAAALRASGAWRDVVPGKREVTVQFNPLELPPRAALERLKAQCQSIPAGETNAVRAITLQMQADETSAPDLARLAAENGLSQSGFLQCVIASPLIVDMMGFTAGFAYVTGVDPSLAAARLDVPRQRVAVGSVGFISGQLGLYALAGPAGWPIIGRVTEPLFDAQSATPFTLEAGMRISLRIGG
jgi:KipI family sensor histidine kinase inhibitor